MEVVCFCPTFAHVIHTQQVSWLLVLSCVLPSPQGAQAHGLSPGRVWSESNRGSTQWTFQDNTYFPWPLARTIPRLSCKRQLWLTPGSWQPNPAPSLPEQQQIQQQFTPWLKPLLFWAMVTSSSLTHLDVVSPTALLGDAVSSPLAPASWKCPACFPTLLLNDINQEHFLGFLVNKKLT